MIYAVVERRPYDSVIFERVFLLMLTSLVTCTVHLTVKLIGLFCVFLY